MIKDRLSLGGAPGPPGIPLWKTGKMNQVELLTIVVKHPGGGTISQIPNPHQTDQTKDPYPLEKTPLEPRSPRADVSIGRRGKDAFET